MPRHLDVYANSGVATFPGADRRAMFRRTRGGAPREFNRGKSWPWRETYPCADRVARANDPGMQKKSFSEVHHGTT